MVENILTVKSKSMALMQSNMILTENIDYFCIDKGTVKEEQSIVFVIRFIGILPTNEIAENLADVIISNFEYDIIKDVLQEKFIGFTHDEVLEIIETTKRSLVFFNEIYGRRIIVKKITNYISEYSSLSIEGFIRFRIKEYRRAVEMFIFEAIEELQIKNEYYDFIQLLKIYIETCPSLIDFVHIKIDSSGKYSFYDFKKAEIRLENEKSDSIEIFLTMDDLVMNILISLAPKRILWHINPQYPNSKILNTLKQIFGERLSVCNGCEFCSDN